MTHPTIEYYKGFFKSYFQTGSTVIVPEEDQKDNPPQDVDYIALIDPSVRRNLESFLELDGFEIGGSDTGISTFHSWKRFHPEKGDDKTLNIILTWNEQHFLTFEKATRLAKALRLSQKADRVTLFQAINRDIWPDNLPDRPLNLSKGVTPSEQLLVGASLKEPPQVVIQEWKNLNEKGLAIHDGWWQVMWGNNAVRLDRADEA